MRTRGVEDDFVLTRFFFVSYFSELCDRVEKGIFAEYQKALSKSLNISKIKMKSVIRGSGVSFVGFS